jgi:molybdate transport system substrate-binding protein
MEEANQFEGVVRYATNDLEIMIPAANPKNMQSLKDPGRADVSLSMPNPEWEGVANQIADSL